MFHARPSSITYFSLLRSFAFLLLVTVAGIAHAETFSFSYTAGRINAAGTLTATSEGNEVYQVTGISGQRDGFDIVSLSDYEGADNRLDFAAATPIDYSGLSFLTAAGQMVNLFASQDYPGLERELLADGNNPSDGGFVLHLAAAPATVTPEPASFALLATGMLGAAGIVRRRI